MGALSRATGYGLWREQGWAAMLSHMVLACHGMVFFSLAGMHVLGKTVDVNSIGAMLFRTAIWIVIVIVMLFKSRRRGQEGKR